MFSTLARRAAQAATKEAEAIPYIFTNPYKAQRSWPPDFSKLHPKAQFRLERKYKRRAKLKWARPRWTKGVKLAQMGVISFVLVYGVLFLDWNNAAHAARPEHEPFQGIRSWFFGLTGSMWTKDQVRRKPEDAAPTSNASATRGI